jgi:hypothetical protein
MEFKFDASQDFQLQAIEAVVGLLEGQPRVEADLRFAAGARRGGRTDAGKDPAAARDGHEGAGGGG